VFVEKYSKFFWFSYLFVNLYVVFTVSLFLYLYTSGSANNLTDNHVYILIELSIRLAFSCGIFIGANIFFLRGGKLGTPIVFITAWVWVNFLYDYFAPGAPLFRSIDNFATTVINSRLIFVLLITYLAVEINVKETTQAYLNE